MAKNRYPRKVAGIVLTTACIAALAACSPEPDNNPDGNGNAASEVSVAIISHYSGPAPTDFKNGGQAAADQLGAKLHAASPPDIDASAQIQLFKDAIIAGAEGVAVVPYPADVWHNTIEDALDEGVQIAAFNADAPETGIPLYVGVNETAFGHTLGELTLDLLGGPASTGQVVVGNCLPGVDVVERRATGIKEYMSDNAAGIEVLGPFSTEGDPTASFAAWQDLRAKYPDAVALVGVCTGDGPSISRVQAGEGAGSFVGVTADVGPEIFDAFRAGTIQGAVSQSPWMQGYAPVRALIESLQNGTPMPEGWLDSGSIVVTVDNFEEEEECNTSPEAQAECYVPLGDALFADFDTNLRPMSDLTQ